jgi:hypothetical protein
MMVIIDGPLEMPSMFTLAMPLELRSGTCLMHIHHDVDRFNDRSIALSS